MPKSGKGASKEGLGRLLELAERKKGQLTGACVLSVLSSFARLVPFFTIYGVLHELIISLSHSGGINMQRIWTLSLITLAAAGVYGVCAYFSAVLSHTAAFNILCDIRIQLTEKLSRVSHGVLFPYDPGNRSGRHKELVEQDGIYQRLWKQQKAGSWRMV